MNFRLTKNIHFTKLVKTLDRLREFNFRMIPGSSNSLLHVDVPDDRGNRIVFKMQRDDNTPWKVLGEQLPTWITASEKNLNDLIEEELH
ncbi:MAG: hypothetical protein NVS1B13_24730 [Flavisolibacter sp.]